MKTISLNNQIESGIDRDGVISKSGALIKSFQPGKLELSSADLKGKIKDEIIDKVLETELKVNRGYYIEIPRGKEIVSPIIINHLINHNHPVINEKNVIMVGKDARVTIVFDYTTEEGLIGIRNGVTELYVEDRSVVNILKLQRQNSLSYSIDGNYATITGKGKVNWFSVELGSNSSITSYITDLKGEGSEGNLSSIYFGNGKREYDFTYTMEHSGPHSISRIDSRGVLKDQAIKKLNGKLKFNQGAIKSRGSESEHVLLLDPTVNSTVIPSIFCEEEDVSGHHAANAGKIKESQLYYLMSRGLSLYEAKKILVEAALNPLIEKIPVDYVKSKIAGEIRRRLET